jgi:hypothetical protein
MNDLTAQIPTAKVTQIIQPSILNRKPVFDMNDPSIRKVVAESTNEELREFKEMVQKYLKIPRKYQKQPKG